MTNKTDDTETAMVDEATTLLADILTRNNGLLPNDQTDRAMNFVQKSIRRKGNTARLPLAA